MKAAPLLDRTRNLLGKTPEKLTHIAKNSGLGYEWLKKFKMDAIPNPGVRNVQQLHDYLAGKAA